MASEYGTRLRAARKHAHLTQVELSKRTGIPQSTISTAEREGHGSSDTPVYARACGVDAHWLATGEGEMVPRHQTARVKMSLAEGEHADLMATLGAVPLISWAQAATWSDSADPMNRNVGAEAWLPCPAEHGQRTYCLRVRGESMLNPSGGPSYAEGDIIFVDPDRQCRPGDRVVVRLGDHAEATFKQLVVEDGRTVLKALNPDWKPRYIEADQHAVPAGVVIGRWTPE